MSMVVLRAKEEGIDGRSTKETKCIRSNQESVRSSEEESS